MKIISRLISVLSLSLLFLSGFQTPIMADDSALKVQLMSKADLGGYNGCRYALWQHNRSPKKDTYAYALLMPYNDGEPLPAWFKINGQIREMEPKARGGWRDGYLSQYMLYRDAQSGYFAIVNILGKKNVGDDLLVTNARIRILHSGKKTFTIRTKGHILCPTQKKAKTVKPTSSPLVTHKLTYASGYDRINLKKIRDFKSLKAVPLNIRKHIQQKMPNCDLGAVPPYGTAYAVSSARTLWEIPCYTGAFQGSYVYADSLNANKKHFTFLEFSEPDGSKPRFELLNPKIILKGSLFISTALSRGLGDCGKREIYQLVPDVGEELLFVLLERREKKKCDGKASPPKSWPVTYQQK